MQLELGRLDSGPLAITLPGRAGAAERTIRVGAATNLSGRIEQTAEALQLSGVLAEQLLLETLRLVFGSVVLSASRNAELAGVVLHYASGAAIPLSAELRLEQLRAGELRVDVKSVHVRAQTWLQGPVLQLDDEIGTIDSELAEFAHFELEIGKLQLRAPQVRAQELGLRWGDPAGFSLRARLVTAPRAQLQLGGLTLELAELAIRDLSIVGSEIRAGGLSAAQVEGVLELPESARAPGEATAPADVRPFFDCALLDGLAGKLHVDVGMEVGVPIIGARRAVHKLRLQLVDGTLDYRELEHDLSTLEDTLLDFAVRDGALVLELGIPLLPTRGRGKPLLRWPLSEPELALAEQNRLRLASLPRAEPANGRAEPESENGAEKERSNSFPLRTLKAGNLDADLRLAAPPARLPAALRSLRFDRLTARGAITYRNEGASSEGLVELAGAALEACIADLSLGESRLDLESLHLVQVPIVRVHLDGVQPRRVELAIDGLTTRDVSLR